MVFPYNILAFSWIDTICPLGHFCKIIYFKELSNTYKLILYIQLNQRKIFIETKIRFLIDNSNWLKSSSIELKIIATSSKIYCCALTVNSHCACARTFKCIWMLESARVPLFTILMFPKWRLSHVSWATFNLKIYQLRKLKNTLNEHWM